MKALCSLDLRSVSGGSNAGAAILHALGNVSSTIGYMLAVQIKRTAGKWGLLARETTMGAASAAAITKLATHSLWDRPGNNPADGTAAAMCGCFILGAGVGLAEGIIKSAAAAFIKK